jgi:hypothetical protein
MTEDGHKVVDKGAFPGVGKTSLEIVVHSHIRDFLAYTCFIDHEYPTFKELLTSTSGHLKH